MQFPVEVQAIKQELSNASKNLFYISERDHPFEFVYFPHAAQFTSLPSTAPEFASHVLNRSQDVLDAEKKDENFEDRYRVIEFSSFMDRLQQMGASVAEPEAETNPYENLRRVIERVFETANLNGAANVKIKGVYRVGGLTPALVEIYITILLKGVGVVGLKTMSVET